MTIKTRKKVDRRIGMSGRFIIQAFVEDRINVNITFFPSGGGKGLTFFKLMRAFFAGGYCVGGTLTVQSSGRMAQIVWYNGGWEW
jgi:hypothetical protein